MSYYHIDDNKYSLSARTWSIPFITMAGANQWARFKSILEYIIWQWKWDYSSHLDAWGNIKSNNKWRYSQDDNFISWY